MAARRRIATGERLRRVLAVAAVFLVAALITHGAVADEHAAGRPAALGPAGRVAVPPFGVGETLSFEIKYGFVSAGTAIMAIPRIVTERGHECYNIVSLAESNSFFSMIFTVKDVAESFLDVRELLPRRFEKRLREGDFRSQDLVIFDHDRHVAIYPRKNDRVVPISAGAQDILSSLYYVRMMDLKVGSSVFIENHADKKNYPLEIKVLRRERVRVPAGEFDCIVVEPVMRGAGLFSQKGRLTVWLADNEARIPVLMKSKVMIGSITATLTDFTYADGLR